MTFSRAFPVVSSLVFANSWYIREPHVFGGGNFLKIRGWHPEPSTQYPVPQCGVLGFWEIVGCWSNMGSETTVACDDHYQVFRLLQPNYVMGGWVAKLAPQAHGTLLLFFRRIFFSLLVGFYELRPSNCGGSQRAAKFAAMQTAPRLLCTLPSVVKY